MAEDDNAITQRLRRLESIVEVMDYRLKKADETAEVVVALKDRLGNTQLDMMERVDKKISEAANAIRDEMEKLHADNAQKYMELTREIKDIVKKIAFAAGGLATLQVLLQFLPIGK